MYGSLIVELQNGVKAEEVLESIEYKILGKTIKDEFIQIEKECIDLNQLISEWESPLQDIFPAKEDIKEEMLKTIPLKRFGNPKDIANLAVFLSSCNSDYITGQIISVDGGMSI